MRHKSTLSGYNDEYHRNVCEALYAINRAINYLQEVGSVKENMLDTPSLGHARDLMWTIIEREEKEGKQ
jgi:hypothetical protein